MRKNVGVLAFLTIALSNFVSAGPVQGVQQLTDGFREVAYILIGFIGGLIGDINSFDEYLFAKLLLFLIIFFVVYTVLKNQTLFGGSDRKTMRIVMSAAICILAIRYLPTGFVEFILLQYSTFAVAITTLLPFMIFFFFLHLSEFGHWGRQIGWILYGVIMIAMFIFRVDQLGNAQYVYYAGIAGIAIAFLFDRPIHDQFMKKDVEVLRKSGYMKRFISNEKQIQEFEDMLDKVSGSVKRSIEKEIIKLKEANKKLRKKF